MNIITGIISPGSWPEGTTGGQLIVTGGANFNNAIAVSTPGWELVIDGGTTTLNASNSYNGSTMIINGATLVAAKGNALPTNYGGTPIFLDQDSSGASWGTGYSTLALPVAQTIASLSGRVSSLVNLAGYTLTIGTDGATNTYAGTIIDGLVDSWYGYGPGSLAKVGNSTQILTGNSRYSGTTTISGGTLQIGAGGTSGTLGSGAITNNGTLVVKRSDAFTLANTISGSGTFTQAGAGTTTLIGTNSGFSGLTKISAGALQYGDGSTAGTSVGTGDFTNNGVLAFNPNSTDNYTVAGNISGTGSVSMLGSGTTTLSGSNSYEGGTTLSGGTLTAGNINAFGTGALTIGANTFLDLAGYNIANTLTNNGGTILNVGTISGGDFSGGTTDLSGSNSTVAEVKGTATVNVSGTDTAITTVSGGTLNVNAARTTIQSYNGGNLAVGAGLSVRINHGTSSGRISGAGGLAKAGAGTVTLTGTSTYTGATTVSEGKLVINGNISTSTLTTVDVGATIGGTGTVGATIINGTLAVGNSPGQMDFTNTLSLNGSTVMEIDGTAGAGVTGGHDFVNLTGDGAAGVLSYGGTMTIDIGAIFTAGGYSWNLFDMASETGTFASITLADQYSGTLLDVDLDGVWDLTSGSDTWQFTEATGNLSLTVIPEPNVAILSGGLGVLALLRRRRN